MKDEGPSPEDIERFGSDEGYCPKCGEAVWDQAPVCPGCGEHISGRTSSRPPELRQGRQRWIIAVALIVLLGFLLTRGFL